MLKHVSTIESGPPAIRAGRREGATLRAGYDAFFDAAAGLAGLAPPSNDGRGLHRGARKVMGPAGGWPPPRPRRPPVARATRPIPAPRLPPFPRYSSVSTAPHRSASPRAPRVATL